MSETAWLREVLERAEANIDSWPEWTRLKIDSVNQNDASDRGSSSIDREDTETMTFVPNQLIMNI
jgi:hypothetical protein